MDISAHFLIRKQNHMLTCVEAVSLFKVFMVNRLKIASNLLPQPFSN